MSRPRVLVAIPIKPTLNALLKAKCVECATAMLGANLAIDLGIFFDATAEPSQSTDCRAWSKVARVRNKIVNSTDLNRWDYLLWIDADVVSYPPDMPTRLLAGNPAGVSAPMVYVEGGDRFDNATFGQAVYVTVTGQRNAG